MKTTLEAPMDDLITNPRSLQERQEAVRLLDGVEVKVDDDVVVVVDRLLNALAAYPGLRTEPRELVERGLPGGEVRDRMLDVQGRHDSSERVGRCGRH